LIFPNTAAPEIGVSGDPISREAIMSFATDLDRLIMQHVGHPKHRDDFQEVVGAL
jgi:hypothetical protein